MQNRFMTLTRAMVLSALCLTAAHADRVFLPTGDKDSPLEAVAQGLQKSISPDKKNPIQICTPGNGDLKIGSDERLFIIVHGHAALPWFCSVLADISWTADEMAELLEKQGLPKNHKDIYLLVCYGGQSVGDKRKVGEILTLRNEAKAAEAAGDSALCQKTTKAFKDLTKRTRPGKYKNENQELPLAAQLAQALKDRRYKNFRIISYNGAINADAVKEGNVRLFLDPNVVDGKLAEGLRPLPKTKKESDMKKYTEEDLKAVYGESSDQTIYRSIWR